MKGTDHFKRTIQMYLEQSPSYPEELTVLQACFHSKNETVRLIAEYELSLIHISFPLP